MQKDLCKKIQGTFQRFAVFINRLPVELQVKAIRLLVERITMFKDHVVVKVFGLCKNT
mgnify:CR=1 FL=1